MLPVFQAISFPGLAVGASKDIVAFLKTGKTARTVAYGPMAEVVENSTSKMSDADLMSVATYLKSLSAPKAANASSKSVPPAGKTIYNDACSACHQKNGEGVPKAVPESQRRCSRSVGKTHDSDPSDPQWRPCCIDREKSDIPVHACIWLELSDSHMVAAVASYVREAPGAIRARRFRPAM